MRSAAFAAVPGCLRRSRAVVSLHACRRAYRHTAPRMTRAGDKTEYDVQSVILDRRIAVPSAVLLGARDTVNVNLKAENLGGRRRRISGGIDIETSIERVWCVLKAYEAMDLYIPNITKSIVQVKSGVTYLDQIGIISNKLKLSSRMLMRVTENFADMTLTFTRVEGRDFSDFEGRYMLRDCGPSRMRLDYELLAVPFPFFPVSLVERKIVKEVPRMLASVRDESIQGNHVPL